MLTSPPGWCRRDELKRAGCKWNGTQWLFMTYYQAAVMEILYRAAGVAPPAAPPPAVTPTPQKAEPARRRPAPAAAYILGRDTYLVELPRGRIAVFGPLLPATERMLTRIFKMKRASAAVAEAAGRPPSDTKHGWVSSFALDSTERAFFEVVLRRRVAALARGADQRAPIPTTAGPVPERFRPLDMFMRPLPGPFTARRGLPKNRGCQFFSNDASGPAGFLWADGTGTAEHERLEAAAYPGDC